MQRDRQFRVEGKWALASDGMQWVVQYDGHAVSFVRSTKEILARCLREKGCEYVIAENLLAGLPDSFDEWKRHELPAADVLNKTPQTETLRNTDEMVQSGDGVPN